MSEYYDVPAHIGSVNDSIKQLSNATAVEIPTLSETPTVEEVNNVASAVKRAGRESSAARGKAQSIFSSLGMANDPHANSRGRW